MKVLITIPVYNEELVLEKNIKKLFVKEKERCFVSLLKDGI